MRALPSLEFCTGRGLPLVTIATLSYHNAKPRQFREAARACVGTGIVAKLSPVSGLEAGIAATPLTLRGVFVSPPTCKCKSRIRRILNNFTITAAA